MSRKVIYLGCPYCGYLVLLSTFTSHKKWNPEKIKTCPDCLCESELSEWNWFEKHMVPFYRPISFDESTLELRSSTPKVKT